MKKRVLFTLACLFLWTGMAMAQVSRITGVVVSAEDNEPIVGASRLTLRSVNRVHNCVKRIRK